MALEKSAHDASISACNILNSVNALRLEDLVDRLVPVEPVPAIHLYVGVNRGVGFASLLQRSKLVLRCPLSERWAVYHPKVITSKNVYRALNKGV